jgi:hypothetical protein
MAIMKMIDFWDTALCNLVEAAVMMVAVMTTETLVNFDETTRCSIPEGCFRFRGLGVCSDFKPTFAVPLICLSVSPWT